MECHVDCHGVPRAKCLGCSSCPAFVTEVGSIKCAYCSCAPALHQAVIVEATDESDHVKSGRSDGDDEGRCSDCEEAATCQPEDPAEKCLPGLEVRDELNGKVAICKLILVYLEDSSANLACNKPMAIVNMT